MFTKLINYLRKNNELNIELFKILGIGGVGISFIAGFYSLITLDIMGTVIDFTAGILAILLLYYVEKTGHYMTGYLVVEFFVFAILFAVLFFTGSGMDGSMPYFFSFGLMFTFLMFEGKLLWLMESFLSVFYLGCCILSIRYPQLVQVSGSSLPMNCERIIGVFLPAFSMGMIFLLYIREYKAQKRNAEEANEAKSIFLANMSHEIRTPINAVLGFNEMILRTSKDTITKEYAGYIDQSGHRLLKVINEILEFSKSESGKSELITETFSLRDLAHEMKSMMSVTARKKSLAYQVDIDEDLHDMVQGDREKLLRILMNLLSNAFKYTEEGSVTLHMRLMGMTEEGQKIYFSVEDSGIGIKSSEISNLFHAYERADLKKNRSVEGTGLGLAITQQLLHMLGSKVEVESTYHKGSTFSFELTLPLADELNMVMENEKKQSSFIAPDADVLVVDDDEVNRRLMDSFLGMFRISADFAESGEACLEKLKSSDYHLILMDYMMPGMDGAQTMEAIRSREEKMGKHTPILVLTADVVDDIRERLLARGFDDYLSKPVDFAELGRSLLKYIPDELVKEEAPQDKTLISSRQYEACEELMRDKGLNFSAGMKLVNEDFSQYLRIAEFFVNNASADMHILQEASDEEDITRLRISLHSLKGKAGSVGAEELRATAENLEQRCRNSDIDYVLCSMDLLMLQWQRSVEGLRLLLETVSESDSHQIATESSALEHYNFDDLLEELHRNLALHEAKKARSVIQELKRRKEDDSFTGRLDEIADLLDKMEFDRALELTFKEKIFMEERE